jgi:hypothetical protein
MQPAIRFDQQREVLPFLTRGAFRDLEDSLRIFQQRFHANSLSAASRFFLSHLLHRIALQIPEEISNCSARGIV